jgi:hypothetical protein
MQCAQVRAVERKLVRRVLERRHLSRSKQWNRCSCSAESLKSGQCGSAVSEWACAGGTVRRMRTSSSMSEQRALPID